MTIFSRLDDLRTCLCAQIELDDLPSLCFCGIVPGSEVAVEYQGDCTDRCGMAWIRLASLYPAVSVGQVSTQMGNCGNMMGVDVEVGVMRCMPVGGYDGLPPTPAQLRAATELQVKDAQAIWKAVVCCQGSDDWIIGQYRPFGPDGGIVGGIVEINFLEL